MDVSIAVGLKELGQEIGIVCRGETAALSHEKVGGVQASDLILPQVAAQDKFDRPNDSQIVNERLAYLCR